LQQLSTTITDQVLSLNFLLKFSNLGIDIPGRLEEGGKSVTKYMYQMKLSVKQVPRIAALLSEREE
jgi:hypothetical protein